jgi:hypothetical protein
MPSFPRRQVAHAREKLLVFGRFPPAPHRAMITWNRFA